MAQPAGIGRVVGNYFVGRQIGSGSFSIVFHARHRVHGTEVAIKEIVMSRLKYCKGGDLSMYVTRHGSVPEATAKHFMQQLAAGLQVLHDNNLIHRDLKPQNLLLTTNDSNAVLKIADFGFARSLQPRGLAETLCGSPLYMAPEIMQLQKYDAKPDLWSVGAILFQLVTGKTPFTGNNQIQLLQNILKSTDLPFPTENDYLTADCKDLCQKLLRYNPVERLTFEEFFNHPFLSLGPPDKSLSPVMNTEESFQEDCLPFFLDDDSCESDVSPSFAKKRSSMKSAYGFSVDAKDTRGATPSALNKVDFTSKYSVTRHKSESAGFKLESCKVSGETLHEPHKSMDQRPANICSRVRESLESIDHDYILVSGPSMDVSSSSASTSKPNHIVYKSENPPLIPFNSAPGTSQGSMDIGDMEQPSSHCMTRIKSLQQCSSAVTELVHEKIEAGRQLEAFSIQLVILAIWKQALHICHTQAASAMEGSPSQETSRLSASKKLGTSDREECNDIVSQEGPADISSEIEREFLREVEHAEELAKVIEPGSTEMPDAMETIFQAALALGRYGGVDELMGDMESAALLYSKAERLLVFLLVEAPSLILNPPFSLTNSDRYRLRTYIDFLRNRQGYSRSQMMALLGCKDQP
ncbi:PRA1 family protein A2 isoform 2 [Hibiscus syriacus]|uniref:PRA1 family protein A2 isoform 2 n=1 Tax=Hibiscus syriacus TaxID=106335 RepID=A0A6A2ZP16_HIBSY|nr:PRA1 family protein A2 isoform 2 [Hibiscus syriacus]